MVLTWLENAGFFRSHSRPSLLKIMRAELA
jgi:hypothetical protein